MAKINKSRIGKPAPVIDEEDEATPAAIGEGIRDAKAGRSISADKVRKLLSYASRSGIEVNRVYAEPQQGEKGTPQRARTSRVIGLGKFRSGISDLGSDKNRLAKFGRR